MTVELWLPSEGSKAALSNFLSFQLTMNHGGCYVTAKRRSVKREEFVRNWEFYLTFPRMLQCGDHELPTYDFNGEDGKYSFVCLENGLFVPTRELDLVRRVLEGKKSINLQIKLWSEDVGHLLMPDELFGYCRGFPEWVFKATIEQSQKRFLNEMGYVPFFMKQTPVW
jgi:hypothetical protein